MDGPHYIDPERRLRDRFQFASPFAKPEAGPMSQLILQLQQRLRRPDPWAAQRAQPYPDLSGSAD